MKRLIGLLIAASLCLPVAASAYWKSIQQVGVVSGGALACSYTPVTTGTQGTAYTGATPSASGGTPAYTYSETGTLPGGLTISSSTGIISGTPTANGSFPTIQVVVTDSASNTANCGSAFTLVISPTGCSDTNATAWVNAVVTAGGTVSGTQQTNVCNLIVALKGHGLYAKMDRMWLYASENATQASIDIVNLSTHTITGTPTFTASQGYTGTGVGTSFINTNYNPNVNGSVIGINNESIGAYVRTNRTTSSNFSEMGGTDATRTTVLQINAFTGHYIATINNSSVGNISGATTSQGFYVGTVTASGTGVLYKNGSSIATASTVATAFTNVNLYALAQNNNGTTFQVTTDQIAVILIGSGLSSTDNTNLSSDINGLYMTALGTNVY